MSDLVELSGMELEAVGGGRVSNAVVVQNNINVNPQVAVGVAVLSPDAYVNASNRSSAVQLNLANLA